MARNRFVNPVNGGTYTWPQNHSEEDPTVKTRTVTRSANTGTVGAVRQQGDDGPLMLKLNGTILQRAQLQSFWAWYNLSRYQSIYFYDYDNQGYEVLMTELSVTRKRKLSFTGRDRGMPYHYYEYSMTMEVLVVLAGDMAGVAP